MLTAGVDDIFWVNQLQAALLRAGYYPGEEDCEDYIFGDSTHSALVTFQASFVVAILDMYHRGSLASIPKMSPSIASSYSATLS